jgi:hypothetical protein
VEAVQHGRLIPRVVGESHVKLRGIQRQLRSRHGYFSLVGVDDDIVLFVSNVEELDNEECEYAQIGKDCEDSTEARLEGGSSFEG